MRDATRPVFDLLKSLVEQTGGTLQPGSPPRRVVVAEPTFVDAAMIWKLHGGSPRVRFYHDQPNLKTSVENASVDVEADMRRTRVVLTTSVESMISPPQDAPPAPQGAPAPGDKKDSAIESVRATLQDVEQLALGVEGPVTWKRFQEILKDRDASQLVVLTRVEDDAILFADGPVPDGAVLDTFARADHDKDLVYIVSNRSVELAEALASTGRVKRAVSSTYLAGVGDSLRRAFGSMPRLPGGVRDAGGELHRSLLRSPAGRGPRREIEARIARELEGARGHDPAEHPESVSRGSACTSRRGPGADPAGRQAARTEPPHGRHF